ncbi:hypothetical protein [Maribacter sp. 2210JD10-5]|uniref:hypothetical protein n=1 Tax=Maribacter sp. 2210JD10-5 TaxID=3386272 RepID=UPI0039BCD118
MKPIIRIVFSFITTLSFSQNSHEGIVLEADDRLPIEFVNVYNSKESTTTNEEGRFSFSSSLDSIFFYRPGYDKLATTFNKINDTVYLKRSLFELDEVVVTNAKSIYQKIKDSVAQNYLLKPHTETFFLRVTLRKNRDLIRFQDFYGKVRRKTSIYAGSLELEKDDFQIQLEHMRKVGISKEANGIYFTFPSFDNIYKEFVRINAMGPSFEVIEKPFTDSENIKVEFEFENNGEGTETYGDYIINGADNAILSFNVLYKPYYKTTPDLDKHSSRVIKSEVSVNFTEDLQRERYYIKSAKRNISFQIKNEKQTHLDDYEMDINLYTLNSFGTGEIKSNINEQKDIFKIKHTYDEVFWRNQKQLLLSDEMLKFIESSQNKNKGYKISSNLKN